MHSPAAASSCAFLPLIAIPLLHKETAVCELRLLKKARTQIPADRIRTFPSPLLQEQLLIGHYANMIVCTCDDGAK